MFKSIFSKMFTMNILIILFIFAVIGIALFPILGDYATRQQREMLLSYADRINDSTENAISGDMLYMQYAMRLATDNANADVIVTNLDGKIVAVSYTDENRIAQTQLTEKQYRDVLLGQTVTRIGTFEGMYNYPVFTIGTPLLYNKQIIGTIFFNTPLPTIYKTRSEILWLLMWTVVCAFFLEFFLLFTSTRRFSNNIREISGAAKKLADGQFGKRVTVKSQDEIGELALSFNQMAESLEKLEELRRSFIANASHELRTPVTTITGFVEGILDQTIPPEKQEEYLRVVLAESKRLGRLTSSLLDVAKLDSSDVALEYSDFDINELVRLTLINLEAAIDSKKLDVDIYFADDPIFVRADKDAIQRVLINLFENAVKYTDASGSIRAKVLMEKSKVTIAIENSGHGIAKDDLPHIFTRFYKGDKSRGLDKKGVGLGLFIVKNIITLHQQKIWAESEPDQFTRFTFTLARGKKPENKSEMKMIEKKE